MTYLRSQSQYGAALGPEREQNVTVICNAFGVNPALAGRNEAAIATVMHKHLMGATRKKPREGSKGVELTRARAEAIVSFCKGWRTSAEITRALGLSRNAWDRARKHCLRHGTVRVRGKNNHTEYIAADGAEKQGRYVPKRDQTMKERRAAILNLAPPITRVSVAEELCLASSTAGRDLDALTKQGKLVRKRHGKGYKYEAVK